MGLTAYKKRRQFPPYKRLLDLILVLISSPFWIPVFLLIAILVRIKLGSPVLFEQPRPGLNGKIYKMVKFRSMSDASGSDGSLLPDRYRIGRFGRWLRSTSLDELPELICVLKGDMSLVGPRPLLVQYLNRYSSEQHRRHDMPPGITGLAQICGRNSITWSEKFSHDLYYVDKAGVLLDLYILWRTFRTVVSREGVSAEGEETMPEFFG